MVLRSFRCVEPQFSLKLLTSFSVGSPYQIECTLHVCVFVPCETSAIINGNKNRSMILNCFRDCIIFNSGLVRSARTYTSFAFKFLVQFEACEQRVHIACYTAVSVLFARSPACFPEFALMWCVFRCICNCMRVRSIPMQLACSVLLTLALFAMSFSVWLVYIWAVVYLMQRMFNISESSWSIALKMGKETEWSVLRSLVDEILTKINFRTDSNLGLHLAIFLRFNWVRFIVNSFPSMMMNSKKSNKSNGFLKESDQWN